MGNNEKKAKLYISISIFFLLAQIVWIKLMFSNANLAFTLAIAASFVTSVLCCINSLFLKTTKIGWIILAIHGLAMLGCVYLSFHTETSAGTM